MKHPAVPPEGGCLSITASLARLMAALTDTAVLYRVVPVMLEKRYLSLLEKCLGDLVDSSMNIFSTRNPEGSLILFASNLLPVCDIVY